MDNFHQLIIDKVLKIFSNKIFAGIVIAISAGCTSILLNYLDLAKFVRIFAFIFFMFLCTVFFFALIFAVFYIIFYIPRAVKYNGVIHRLEFFFILFSTTLFSVLNKLLFFSQEYKFDYAPTIFMYSIGILFYIFLFYVETSALLKRLRDIKWSKWLVIPGMIPVVCLLIRVPCLFIKSKNEEITEKISSDDIERTFEVKKNEIVKLNNKPMIIAFSIIVILSFCLIFSLFLVFNLHEKIKKNQIKNEYIIKTKYNLKKANWVPLNEKWSFDINQITKSGDYAMIASKTLINERKDGKFVRYACYVDVLRKDTFEHKTVLLINLDDNFNKISSVEFPYGNEVGIYPEDSVLHLLRDIAFMSKEQLSADKLLFDMGMFDYFIPNVSSPSYESDYNQKLDVSEFERELENIRKERLQTKNL